MQPETWCQFVACPPSLNRNRVLQSLEESGVRLKKESGGLCTLFFHDEEAAQLRAAVLEARRVSPRILLVSLAPLAPAASLCWELLLLGGADVLHWESSRSAALDIRRRLSRWQEIELTLASPVVSDHLIGVSAAWTSTLRRLIEIARFSNSPCLLEGESGTGKELAAQLIHTLDARPSRKDLVVVDCSTIVPELSGSEFFGHERGAYTGAMSRREGAFALADGGTLFLDEVGELSLPMQAQLLRVIQEGAFKPVGGNDWRRTSFRLVSATNRDLAREVNLGRFRSDLYYRIAGSLVTMPPLRERREDILPLGLHFAAPLLAGQGPPAFDGIVTSYLLSRDYPGNVRELRQVITRMCELHCGPGPITLGDVAQEDRTAAPQIESWDASLLQQCIRRALSDGASLKDISRRATECAVEVAVDQAGGNLQRAARRLGVTDRMLQIRRAVQRDNGTSPHKAKSAGA
jgi:transcriptional regulator with GAF, ATPase, and Fis domain